MKLHYHIILSLIFITCSGNQQNKYVELFSHAASQYPNLNDIKWKINYPNSIMWSIEHYDIEAMGKKNDTTCFITFAIFPSIRDTFVNIIEYAELYSNDYYTYYTSYDSTFVPLYRYKYKMEEPDSLIFEFGKDIYFKRGGL